MPPTPPKPPAKAAATPAAKAPAKPPAKAPAKPAAKAPVAKPAAKAAAADRAFEKSKRGLPVTYKESTIPLYGSYEINKENSLRAQRELSRRVMAREQAADNPKNKRPITDHNTYLALGQPYKTSDERKAFKQASEAYTVNDLMTGELKGPKIVGPKLVGPKKVGPKVPKGSGSKSGMNKRGPARPMM